MNLYSHTHIRMNEYKHLHTFMHVSMYMFTGDYV